MSSISAHFKQVPIDTQYYVSLVGTTALNLNRFNKDAASSTTSYVSGAAAGNFTTSNTGTLVSAATANGGTSLFRDMGETIVSSGRTFRAVQLLVLDSTGTTGWTSVTSGTPGVWKAGNEGVVGTSTGVAGTTSDFGVFYFETGARGLGIAQGLVRYG